MRRQPRLLRHALEGTPSQIISCFASPESTQATSDTLTLAAATNQLQETEDGRWSLDFEFLENGTGKKNIYLVAAPSDR